MPRHRLNASLSAFFMLGAAVIAAACGSSSRPPGLLTTSATSTTSTSSGNQGGAGGSGGSEQGGGGDTGTGGMLPGCGDGMIVPPEECDGSDLNGKACTDLGFDSGTLGCNPNSCQFSFSNCKKNELCGNGIDDNLNGLIDCKDPDCSAACSDSCSPAAIVATPGPPFPFQVMGFTTGHANELNATCSSSMGAMSGPEVVYELTAAFAGVLDIALQSNIDLGVSVRTQCDLPAELGCAEKKGGGQVERLKVPVNLGQKVFIIVQGRLPGDAGVYTLTVDNRPVLCGDGFLDGAETCDDTNVTSNDGCSSSCALESTEVEPNNSSANANPYVSPWFAAIKPMGDLDVVSVVVANASSTIAASVHDFDGHSCTDGLLDSILEILDKNGSSVLASIDDVGMSTCSAAQATNLGPGTYFVRVKASPASGVQSFPYKLDIKVTGDVCGDGVKTDGEQCDDNNMAPGDGCSPACLFEITEVEPNGATMTANLYKDPWHAAIQQSGDVDVVSVTVAPGESTLSAVVVDFGTGDCMNQKIVSQMDIIDKDGATVIKSNAGNGDYCAGTSIDNLPPGKYYVRIKAGPLLPNATFPYGLQITVF